MALLEKLAQGLETAMAAVWAEFGSAGLLVAVSGGADSVALLTGLLRVREEGLIDVRELHAAHLEHGLRGQAGRDDAQWVAQFCHERDIECTVGRTDVPAAAAASGESIETEARRQRYQFLARTARERHCPAVALGHTADDQVETILHRIIRGTGVRGLAGMAPLRRLEPEGAPDEATWLVRPMLDISRAEVEEFLRAQGTPWREDATNASPEYTRNRIRHELLPILRSYNPQVEHALLRLGETASWINALITRDAGELLAALTVETGPGRLLLDARRLRQFSRLEQAETVRAALRQLETPERRLGHRHVLSVLDVLRPEGPVAVQLPAGARVRRSGGRLIFIRS